MPLNPPRGLISLSVTPVSGEAQAAAVGDALARRPGIDDVRLVSLDGTHAVFAVTIGDPKLAFPPGSLGTAPDGRYRLELRQIRPTASRQPADADRSRDERAPAQSPVPADGGQRDAIMNALLEVHRQDDAETLLRSMLAAMTPVYGYAAAVWYVLDPVRDELQLELIDDAEGKLRRRLLAAEVSLPRRLPRATAARFLRRLAVHAAPVQIADDLASALGQMWEPATATVVQRVLGIGRVALAPVSTGGRTVGFLALLVQSGWPEAVAAECAAHGAAGLGTIVARRNAAHQAALAISGAIAEIGGREIDRALRYERPLSLVLLSVAPQQGAALDALLPLLKRPVRRPDFVGRPSPQEIAIILTETSPAGTAAFLRRLDANLGGSLAGVGVSSASLPDDGRTWQELLTAARPPAAPPAVDPATEEPPSIRDAFPRCSTLPWARHQ